MLTAFALNIKSNWASILMKLYILSLSFLTIFDLPIVGAKIQPPEIIFGIILIGFLFRFKSSIKFNETKFDKPLNKSLLFYFLAITLSCCFAQQWTSWLEWLGLIYLLLLFVVFTYLLKSLNTDLKKYVITAFYFSGLVAAILGVIGWLLARYGIVTSLAVQPDSYYPYLGYIGRATGFTTNPNMLMSILAVVFLLKFSDLLEKWHSKKTRIDFESLASRSSEIVGLIIIGFGILLTFSKTMLPLGVGILIVWYLHLKSKTIWKRVFVFGCSGILFLIFNFGAHVAIFDKSEIDWTALKKEAYTADHPLAEMGDHYLVATNYLINKESASLAGVQYFPWGVGAGGHNNFVANLKQEGLYPEYFSNYDPHSTYFGAWGEGGLFGLLAVFALFVVVGKTLKKAFHDADEKHKTLIIGVIGCFIYAAIEAITTDIMNFRHFWVLLAILASISWNKPEKGEAV